MNDMSQHSTLMQASHQWASRPSDERFVSLLDMAAHHHHVREHALAQVISSRKVQARPVEGDHKALVIETPNGINTPTNWSFNQLCGLGSAPAGFLGQLPGELAADVLNYRLAERDARDTGIWVHDADSKLPSLAAATGPNYGRIYNSDIDDALIKLFGDGVTGRFKVPGEFGVDVPVTKANTTLYASDRDMFIFLCDEKNRVEVPNRRNGQPGSLGRGFFLWNSEVGAMTFGLATFLFDYVCCNRIVWGAQQYKELRFRHTSSAPDRWIEQVSPAIEHYADSSSAGLESALEHAQQARIDDLDAFLLKRRFTTSQAKAIKLTHEEDEGRPIETVWDAVTGITAYAQSVPYQNERIVLERQAGDILDLVA